MRKLIAGIAALMVSIAPLSPAVAQGATRSVTASNFMFCDTFPEHGPMSYGPNPACTPADLARSPLAIATGDTVRFEYFDAACSALSGCPGHNVVFNDGISEIKPVRAKLQDLATVRPIIFSRTFESAGSYTYTCTIHAATMTGTINVF